MGPGYSLPATLATNAATSVASVPSRIPLGIVPKPRHASSLFGPLVGCHGARRGTYRVIYRIDETTHVVHVLDIDHRSEIYHRPHQ